MEDKPHLLEVEVFLVGKVIISNQLCKKHQQQGVYSEAVDKLILLLFHLGVSSKMLDNLKVVEVFLEEITKLKQQAKLKVEVYLVIKMPQLPLLVVVFSDKIMQPLKPVAYSEAKINQQLPQSEVINKLNKLVYSANNNNQSGAVSLKITKINPECPLAVSFSNTGNHR